jgi:hypothetical protein
MGAAMNGRLASTFLRLRLAILAAGPLAMAGALACLLGAAALAWLLPQGRLLAAVHADAMRAATQPVAVLAAPTTPDANLAAFQRALGERRYAEQQLRTLFALAAKSGLTLQQGDYRSAFDPAARVHTYQVTLPVRGSYKSIWRFAMMALAAIPFASLDEVNLRREAVGDASIDARLRFTLYLRDGGGR